MPTEPIHDPSTAPAAPRSPLAAAVVDALRDDPVALAELRALLTVDEEHGAAQSAERQEPPMFFTTATLAAQLDVSERTIRRAITNGALPAHRRCGKWIVLADDAQQWISTGRTPTAAARGARPRPLSASRGAAAMLAAADAKNPNPRRRTTGATP